MNGLKWTDFEIKILKEAYDNNESLLEISKKTFSNALFKNQIFQRESRQDAQELPHNRLQLRF